MRQMRDFDALIHLLIDRVLIFQIYKNIILRNHVILGSSTGRHSSSTGHKKNARVTSLRNIVMQMR